MAFLEVTEVGKRFGGVIAVDDVSLSVDRGEILGLVGPNGYGKSTLINLLSGFYPADRGRVVYEGTDIGGLPAHRIAGLGIARTFQIPRPFDTMTPRQNIAVSYMFGRSQHSLDEARAAADQWLAFTGLGDVADVGIDQLTSTFSSPGASVTCSPSRLSSRAITTAERSSGGSDNASSIRCSTRAFMRRSLVSCC